MTIDTTDTRDFFASLDKTTTELLRLISSTDSKLINTVPSNSDRTKEIWTVAQLATHITKSNKAIAQALEMKGKIAERSPGERVKELREMFLNFNTKFQSPEFLRPKRENYLKETLVADLKKSIDQLSETRNKINLSEIISLPAFGEITKLELLYFVLYHTQRHIQQLKNILQELHTHFVNGQQYDK